MNVFKLDLQDGKGLVQVVAQTDMDELRIRSFIDELNARMQWIADRVDYLEHRDANGVGANFQEHGGYWPQRSDHEDPSRADQDMIDLDLVEYIDAQITKERA